MPPLLPDSSHNVQSPTPICRTDRLDAKWSQAQCIFRELQGEQSRMQFELETMKMALHEKESELQECRDQMLQTISSFQVSDSDILNAVIMIRDSLCNLILLLPEITGFDQTWHRVHSTLIENDLARRVRVTMRPKDQLDSVQAEIMEHDVFYIVYKVLLAPVLAGVSDKLRLFFSQIVEQMKALEPLKDPKAIKTWRSDTYRALAATNIYQNQLHTRCLETDAYVLEYLREFSFSKDIDWKDLHQRLMDRVLKPAAALATSLMCSPEDYSWCFSFPLRSELKVADIQDFDFIDSSTHCVASKDNMRGIQDLSKIGHYVAPIFPGLRREAEKDNVTIQKPLMLVAFKDAAMKPGSPSEASDLENSPYKPPQTRLGSGSRGSAPGNRSSSTDTGIRRTGLLRFLN